MSSSDEHEEESDPTPSSDINQDQNQDAPWKEIQRQRMKDLFHVNWFPLCL